MTKNYDYIFGIHTVLEALESGQSIDKIQVAGNIKNPHVPEIFKRAKELNVYIQKVPPDKINRITKKNHQGIIAWMSPVAFCKIEDVLPGIYEKGEEPFILVLDGVTDVRNFGAIVRTAECAGVHAIIIPDKGAARINADAMKTSAGALNRVDVCKVNVLSGTVKFLKNSGLKVLGITEKADDLLFETSLKGPLALVLGSEEKGISAQVMKYMDGLVKLPMKGKIASLNVSVAAGIVMYEALRQRK
ncbi:MAG: 23S rRNA (guanosine(2251)-2'-O)-methyltransferase RlmB [Bacteroidota bacterium]|nr:23S rRNA (guanosine(2251)-2'-O)-methyltransferase RlmB [Bacteroidota bacterium]